VTVLEPSIAGDKVLGPIACPHCACIQAARADRFAVLACRTCGSELERRAGRTVDAAFAAASGTFLLLFPTNGLIFLQTAIVGTTRHSYLASGAVELWREGWPAVAILVLMVLVVVPFIRYGVLSLVLGCICLGLRPVWLGRAFRIADVLQAWAMIDVGLLALWIAFSRLNATVPTTPGPGGQGFVAAAILALLSRATLNKAAVWRAVFGQPQLDLSAPLLACEGCGLLAPSAHARLPCPRCRSPLHPRRPGGLRRATAFTVAGVVL